MLQTMSPQNTFLWTDKEDLHRSRRQAVIKSHPEVLKLCGPEPLTKYLVFLVFSIQMLCAHLVKEQPFMSWQFWLTAYLVGATANHNLFLAIHEISHNLAFKTAYYDRLFTIFTNLPIGVPYSAGFRQYHLIHHKFLGVDGADVDLPTAFEAVWLDSVLGKAFFCTFQLLFYAIRPMWVRKIILTRTHYANIITQVVFNICVIQTLGLRAMLYLLLSSLLAGSLHPFAAHFISEHYIINRFQKECKNGLCDVPVLETFSYYGPLNTFTYNVGYHNEHHDFPSIPWSRLPKLHEIAKEFYQPLPSHKNWPYVLWRFVTDKEINLFRRVKRTKGVELRNIAEAD